ncbi:MAG: MerR family transcriptional regulator [Ardenticatenaceae bacterium]|nr:MerR family transcriptional regulator [Ardenticatenaceae bacterium]
MTDRTEEAKLTIGQFGRLAQLSRKALRLYDDKGLLAPTRIDPDSGYRYYTRAQIAQARHIRLLRLMEMPLETIAMVLTTWDDDPLTAQRLIQGHVTAMAKRVTAVQLAARLLQEELEPDKEQKMSFTFSEAEHPAQMIVSIRRNITVPAFHQSIQPTLRQLFDHIREQGAEISGPPVCLYYGPVNESDDGPVEIGVPFTGLVPPAGEIKVRELPAHKTVQVRTFGEYNVYPKLLEMWNGIGKYVHEQNLESNWEHDMTTYEIWHEDETMTICWPVYETAPAAA